MPRLSYSEVSLDVVSTRRCSVDGRRGGVANPEVRICQLQERAASVVDEVAAEHRLRGEAGYREISLSHVTFNGYNALRWEFEVPEHGVLLHKIDTFFTGNRGGDWGILEQAPASQWGQVSSSFDAMAASFSETG